MYTLNVFPIKTHKFHIFVMLDGNWNIKTNLMIVCLQNHTGIHSHCKNDRAIDEDEKLCRNFFYKF